MIIVFGRYFDLLLSEQAIPLTVNNTQLRERSYLARAKRKFFSAFVYNVHSRSTLTRGVVEYVRFFTSVLHKVYSRTHAIIPAFVGSDIAAVGKPQRAAYVRLQVLTCPAASGGGLNRKFLMEI